MVAYERSESVRDNFGKLIYQFQPKTKTLAKKLERILIKLYRQNVSLLFNQTYLNESDCCPTTHTQIGYLLNFNKISFTQVIKDDILSKRRFPLKC